tara:strand:- start:156 stop:365 length:210 start_codon:yes stop_codon:yes gene_type:complete
MFSTALFARLLFDTFYRYLTGSTGQISPTYCSTITASPAGIASTINGVSCVVAAARQSKFSFTIKGTPY